METEKKAIGNNGETKARECLLKSGYSILSMNYRWRHLEIDLIAEKDNTIVFVEVKTRTSRYFGEPYQFVTRAQQKKIIQAANHYIISNNCNQDARFDVVSIVHNQYETTIEHLVSAFMP